MFFVRFLRSLDIICDIYYCLWVCKFFFFFLRRFLDCFVLFCMFLTGFDCFFVFVF